MPNILTQSSWWVINKAITKEVGIDAALLLADLISKQEYFEDRGMLDENGYFFNTRDNIQEDTTLTLYRQNNAISILKRRNL